jgi:indolepyruvate ferredoxin oxidoreductase
MSPTLDRDYTLEHAYTRESGRVYLTGVQALVRLPIEQRRRDRAAGLRTAGFVSGYRGSPLGTYDLALWRARAHLEAHQIRFEPGVNEDLAATAVWGSQQAGLYPDPLTDGVFAIWYGKGPGVDRSCDALKHGNYAGSAPRGGVLVLCGDDPGARSSSIAHQSEPALVHCGIPILNPADVQELLDLGLHGLALSRFSGGWIALKCLTDTVDSARSVEVGPERACSVAPAGFEPPPGGLHIGWSNLPLQVEARLRERHRAVQAWVRTNGLDRAVWDGPRRRLGIVTTGKAYLDVRQALEELGIDPARARELGLCLYKVALSWPLEPEGALRFARGLEDLLVVEEKRAFVEDQLARLLYNRAERPRLLGKTDDVGAPLLSAEGELAPAAVADALRGWLERRLPELAGTLRRPERITPGAVTPGLLRLPSFCSGCPHNRSTVVPEGSLALGGIGCHGMAVWLPERRTLAVTQMGGEGANWIGAAPFTGTRHVFQNLGDGTYFHSGLLAIRAAVTAGVNLTYKILANGAVAMTGGQPIEGESIRGEVTVPEIARQLDAEGVRRIAVVSDDPGKYPRDARFPPGTTFHPRDELERVQRELREIPGVTALVYDQTCAAEARRLRRRGEFPDPERRVVIHEGVCEGCGDCSVESNCISIEPVETELGRKRRINQSSCNKDYSCLRGYCPSFVSVIGGRLRRAELPPLDAAALARLPAPEPAAALRPVGVLLAGIGGGGVVTAGAILAMAAHLEGKGCSELDVTGLAQKNGPVTSHVRIARAPASLHATRIADGGADLLLAFDPVVATGAEVLAKLGRGRTRVVLDEHVAPTADFATHPDLELSLEPFAACLREAVGEGACRVLPATRLAAALLGDALFANLLLLGYAFQRGCLPVGAEALERAIELHGRAVEANRRAFTWGRLAAHDPASVERAARALAGREAPAGDDLEAIVSHRTALLRAYQDAALARRYADRVARVAERERQAGVAGDALARAVARSYAKLLAYKDEYEVARLYTDGSLEAQLAREFEGEYRLRLHLAVQFLPRWLARRDPRTGRAPKRAFGPWVLRLFRLLARLRRLRGTPVDPFGWTAHRRLERRLVRDYEATLEELLAGLTPATHDLAVAIASLPEGIRGFDTVKERSVAEARAKQQDLLAAFRLRAPAGATPKLG